MHQEYEKLHGTELEVSKPKFVKNEANEMPQFTKEVPLKTIVKKHGGRAVIEYEWSLLGGEEIKISLLDVKEDESLQYVHKLKIKDGEEVGSFKIANTVYIIRKTTEEVAKEIVKTSEKISASIIKAIGYFRTTEGNYYTISRAENDWWSLDIRTGLKHFSTNSMDSKQKTRFVDMIIEQALKIYEKGYSLAKLDLSDWVVTKDQVLLENTSRVTKGGPAKEKIGNFIGNIKGLAENGTGQADLFYILTLSVNHMRKEYQNWYVERNGNNVKNGVPEDFQIVEAAERELMN
ncbi:hypothetical protein KJ780_04695 [Candidatus Micrarchaeota archaeon]|nr:hypothetical protein [Candidatus Micrarchaeota archaeon]